MKLKMTVKEHSFLIDGKISTAIWRNSQPMLVAILLLLIYELLESSLIALGSTANLTAFGFTVPITAAMTAFAVGTSIRCNNKVIKSACLEKEFLSNRIGNALMLSGITIAIMSVVAFVFSDYLLLALGNSHWLTSNETSITPALIDDQSDYINYRLLSWLFLGAVWQINAILRALNFTKLASNLMIYWVIIKGGLALLFLLPNSPFYLDSLIALAIVHASSDIIISLMGLYFLNKKVALKWPSLTELKAQCKQPKMAGFLVISQQLVTPISLALLTLLAANYSPTYVAAFALIFKLEAVILLIPMALTTSMPAIIGVNYWSSRYQRVNQAYKIMFTTIIIAQCVIAIILSYSLEFWANSLCPHDNVAIHLKHYLTWVPWGYIAAGCVMVYQSTLNAKDQVVKATALGVLHRFILLIPLAYIGLSTSEYSLYPSLMLAHLITGFLLIYAFNKSNKKLNSNKQETSIIDFKKTIEITKSN
jgi:Na+-driven multidrug efflux pump